MILHRSTIRRTLLAMACCAMVGAAAAAESPGVVSHVKVVSDKTEDVTSLEAWRQSFMKPGMTDREKALAVWESVVRFRHQDNPPNEFLSNEGHPHDPIKDFNVYGYGQCCCASANVEALARYAGLQARAWGITAHSVPEVQWDGKWHLLDGSLMTYFPEADGSIAGVEEISNGVAAWLADHPQAKGNEPELLKTMRDGGWRANGPAILSRCPFYDNNGWLPAATHGWYSTMGEYGSPKKNFLYEYGTALGYEVNVQLRAGERLTRNWSNHGLHVNAAEGQGNGSINAVVGKGDYRYTPAHGDLAPGRIGNGVLEYDVPLASGAFRKGALVAENLASHAEDGRAPAVHVKDAGKPAVLELRMPSSYVFLTGEAKLKAVVGGAGKVTVAFSDNNGLDWKDLATITETGEQRIDLKPLVYRKYDYRLRLTLTGAGTGLDALSLRHDVQHSQRALPALAQGDNRISYSVGKQEGTIVIEGSTNRQFAGKNLQLADFHPVMNHFRDEGAPFLSEGTGDATLPVATPGDLTRLRIGCHYRARDAKDAFDVQVSFDGGKSFTTIDQLAGPTAGNSRYIVFDKVPAHIRNCLVRLSGHQRNTLGFFDLRISADYTEPQGGLAPVKVTYVWDEGGVEKRDVHVATHADEAYTIHCDGKPLLKSLTLERAE